MTPRVVLAIAALAAWLCAHAAPLVDAARGPTPITATTEPPRLGNAVNDDNRLKRNYSYQPPVIPHRIDGYQVDKNFNKCLDCHAREKTAFSQAVPVSATHYIDRNALAMLAQLAVLAPDLRGHRSLAVLPFFHSFGMTMMNSVLRRGMTSVTMPRFELEPFLSLIERHRITILNLVPPIVLALAKHPAVANHDLSSLRFVSAGAAPLGAALQQAAGQRIGVPIRQGYGLTEATLSISSLPFDAPRIKPGGVGRLLPNVEARIVDPASGADLGTNRPGELLLRGPNVMRGYLNQPEATAATLDAGGWLHTGDVALFDDDGELFIVDRLKELIKVKGYQVAPAHLEAMLLQHPAVADAAVIGIADEEAGELPKAYVVLRAPGASAETIMADTARRLAPHERIRVVEFVEAIPKSPSGKILRRQLREHGAGR